MVLERVQGGAVELGVSSDGAFASMSVTR